jgi:small subunit ribosomal protein S6e
MAFKINVSHKGKTYKTESENEVFIGKKISETIDGKDISNELDGYKVEITGTSDISGIPGIKGLEGTGYYRKLLTYGKGMKDTERGLRLKKTLRGEEISLKTMQINCKVIKEGKNKFEDLIKKEEKKE